MAKLWRVSLQSRHTASGTLIVNTFHGVSTEDEASFQGDGSAAEVRDALITALGNPYRAILHVDYNLDTLLVREQLAPGSTDVPEEASHTYNQAGTLTGSGDKLPIPVSILTTIYSNAAIRSGHGRMFLPNPSAASFLQTNGQWDTTTALFTTLIPAFMNAVLADHSVATAAFDTATFHPVVYSRTRHGRAISPYYFDMSSFAVRAAPHWLRSRMTAP